MKLKEKLKDYIVKTIREESEELKNRENLLEENVRNLNAMLAGYGELEENVRNLNAVLAGYGELEENVRNLNAMLAGYGELEENVRNLNAVLAGYGELEENVRNLNAVLAGYGELGENVRNNNILLEGLLKQTLLIREAIEDQYMCSLDSLKDHKKEEKAICDLVYVHYNEKLMPDSRESVKARNAVYIDKLKSWALKRTDNLESIKIIDLGCGECEWIELLKENGFAASGVDGNHVVVEKVKKVLPDVEIFEEEAIHFLKHCKDESVDCISSFHMVEHMDFFTIITLLKECNRVLKPGGMVIIETPNPQNILTETYYFNLDPTHIKPIPPELMKFYLEESGFIIQHSLFLNPLNFAPYKYEEGDPIKDIIFRFNMEQAYSYMATKG